MDKDSLIPSPNLRQQGLGMRLGQGTIGEIKAFHRTTFRAVHYCAIQRETQLDFRSHITRTMPYEQKKLFAALTFSHP